VQRTWFRVVGARRQGDKTAVEDDVQAVHVYLTNAVRKLGIRRRRTELARATSIAPGPSGLLIS